MRTLAGDEPGGNAPGTGEEPGAGERMGAVMEVMSRRSTASPLRLPQMYSTRSG